MMETSNILQTIKTTIARTPWLIAIAALLSLYGWLAYEEVAVWDRSFYLRSLTLPLVLALAVGLFPAAAPYDPDDSMDYWKVASISFKLFLILNGLALVMFKLNSV